MPKLMASCVTGCMDGMKWIKSSPCTSQKISNRVLLINHPLDCPVCDQAGECDYHLSFSTGNQNSFYRRKKELLNENIGPNIQLHEPLYSLLPLCDGCRSINWRSCSRSNGQRIILIYLLISKAVDNEFSGNMIDVCPVGWLIKHLDLNLEYGSNLTMHRDCPTCSGKTIWMFGDEIQMLLEERWNSMK
jgi:NADH-quinone oxidoreductase subunit G